MCFMTRRLRKANKKEKKYKAAIWINAFIFIFLKYVNQEWHETIV